MLQYVSTVAVQVECLAPLQSCPASPSLPPWSVVSHVLLQKQDPLGECGVVLLQVVDGVGLGLPLQQWAEFV